MADRVRALEARLRDPEPAVRFAAVRSLSALAREGTAPVLPETDLVNMHCHSWFSFNAYGHSPSSLAWLARHKGFRAIGLVDMDVLDGVDEFFRATDVLGVRAGAGIETRLFVPEYRGLEINSPGEPGIAYHMGIGFAGGAVPDKVLPVLTDLRERSTRRNREVVARLSSYLSPVSVDYEGDVLPLTPAGMATERHIALACVRRVASEVAVPAGYWARILDIPLGQVEGLAGESALADLVRKRLMKRGGVAYIPPTEESFPVVDAFHHLVLACQALPCVAWLDGTSPAEEAAEQYLRYWLGKGAVVVNIVPDRNWNVPDPVLRRTRIEKLYEIARLAKEYDLPLNIGTEMNTLGQKEADDLHAPELEPLRQAFLDGAHFVYGHTALQRALGLGYQTAWATAHLPTRREKNAFYTRVGYLAPPGESGLLRLASLGSDLSPADLLARLSA
jgi:hypothetical protein